MSQTKKTDPSKPLWYDQPSFKEFKKEYFSEGARPLLFIGSGVSISAGFPNWEELIRRLRTEAAGDLVSVGSDFDEKLRTRQFDEAGSILKKAFKARHPHENEWRTLLKRILADPSPTESVPEVLTTLCELRWERIITTNYDQLIERAYGLCNSGKTLKVYHPWMKGFDASMSDHRRYVFKIHGDIGDDHSSIVLTTEEYEELYTSKKKKRFREALGQILSGASVILFLGFSYEDQYFKKLFNSLYHRTEAPRRSFGLFPQPPPDFSEREHRKISTLVKDTGIRPIYYRNPGDQHEEFVEFLDYLRAPQKYEERFSAPRLKKRATVILLHTGGTIGAIRSDLEKGDELDLHRIPSRFHSRLQKMSDMLQERFRQFYNTAGEFQFELKWEILPPDQQIFSENATVEHWNNLVNKVKEIIYKYLEGPSLITAEHEIAKEGQELRKIYEREKKEYKREYPDGGLTEGTFVEDIADRYIAGIVVLHGTDTLASAAAALALGMSNLPFPIVVTGANRPPQEGSHDEKVAILGKSDAWKNLVTSLYFLQCFGHRFTETFVCFGDTIHHGLNLRKTSIESAPLKRVGVYHQDVEPFIFRNASINKQYLFRLIDGVFCNNCYPIGELSYIELIESKFDHLRHVRQNPFPKEAGKALTRFRFESTVTYIAASPSFPYIDVDQMLEKQPMLRAVLVEGFKSGTYPTIESNRFTQFLSKLYENDIPVILVAHYGIKPDWERYETTKVDRIDIPVLRLYGLIPETALPLLCRVVSSIAPAKWNRPGKGGRSRVGYLVELIQKELRELFTSTKNIISIEFGDITNPNAFGDKLNRNSGPVFASDESRDSSLGIGYATTRGKRKINQEHDKPLVSIPRSDFLWSLSEVIKPVEKVGSGPDGFAILADMGFEWGFEEFHQLCLKKAPQMDPKPFEECSVAERKKLESTAIKMLRLALRALELRGLVFFEKGGEAKIHVTAPVRNGSTTKGSFSFKVRLTRKNERIRGDEKYNVQTYSPPEATFFKDLNDGPVWQDGDDPEIQRTSNEDHFKRLAKQYEALMESSWSHQMTSFDWYILGVFKGFACAMAWFLLFDHWAENHSRVMDAGYDKAMRQSVKCNILQSDESYFAFEITYYGWYEHN